MDKSENAVDRLWNGVEKREKMSQYDLMKLFARYDSEVSEGDFTPEELEEYLAYCEGRADALSPAEWKARYFAYSDDVKDKRLKKQDW